ncbi:hypothetical protein Q8W30_17005 [Neptunomonas phycophila]|jgi:hypothetical protein|uniref:Uncharacterized protein n=1 Tax=Neptunomonas phycophila TaxID=1572645 RepID=A0ABT9EYY5_9GAMM|nr:MULTISPECIES: hypothetical protein [Neptunomonas]MDN2660025.1 hypothetical protein [Neptunomonas sp. CHC150]MDO6469158.1 hypothetical protein [Neptunomonas phycophila]MDP2524270.1 hypothetical protein [Neptunomonas phycophila]
MPSIPNTVNDVTINFSAQANNSVDQRIVDALNEIITSELVEDHSLTSLYVSSANDQHSLPSRHVQGQGKAIDISRVNGKKIVLYYNSDDDVKAVVDALQANFENYQHRRENFGPSLKHKLGSSFPVSGHNDHIHLSVN